MTRATHLPVGRGRLRLRRAPLRSVDVTGDTAAFEAVYRDAHQELYRYARSIVRDEDAAQDVLQSVMEKALAALQAETRDFELRPWLFRVTHNEAISRLRKERPTAELPDALASTAPTMAEQLDDQARLDTLWTDLGSLPERQRQALVLRELNGLGHEEIAAVIDSTARNVKQTIFEARRALMECEDGRAMVCDEVQQQLSDGDGRVRRGRRVQAHLRSCRDCRAFDRALHERPQELRALAPALPAVAAATLLAQLAPGANLGAGLGHAGAAAGAAGAGAGGLATSGGWSLGALGGALATKTAVVASTAVVATGATGAIVVDRVQDSRTPAAPAAGAAGAAGGATGAASGAGSAAGSPTGPSTSSAAGATTPNDRTSGPASTTPAGRPNGTTPGSARGQDRRAAGQARAAEARAAARDRQAGADEPASKGKGKGKVKTKAKSGQAASGTGKSGGGASSTAKSRPKASSGPSSRSTSPKAASRGGDSGTAPSSGSAGKGSSGTSDAPASKAPATGGGSERDSSAGAGGTTEGTGASPPPSAADGPSKKPEK